MQALNLRVSAKRLDWIERPIRDDEESTGIANVYLLLMALSIENLLKGLLSIQTEVLTDEKLSKEFNTHNLRELARRIDPSTIPIEFVEEELVIMDYLTSYIQWAGRYPLPKFADHLIGRGASSMEYKCELRLWEHLYQTLVRFGWVTKAGGRRLYFRDMPIGGNNNEKNG